MCVPPNKCQIFRGPALHAPKKYIYAPPRKRLPATQHATVSIITKHAYDSDLGFISCNLCFLMTRYINIMPHDGQTPSHACIQLIMYVFCCHIKLQAPTTSSIRSIYLYCVLYLLAFLMEKRKQDQLTINKAARKKRIHITVVSCMCTHT